MKKVTPRGCASQGRLSHGRHHNPANNARMGVAIWSAWAIVVAVTAIHVGAALIAMQRCRTKTEFLPVPGDAPAVSLIRPLCGIENHIEDTLRASFMLEYPCYEIVFCVAHADDPIVPVVQRLMADNQHLTARLLIGDERISDNPKLNNIYKGWLESAHEWVVIADSNVAMPRDYIQRLLAAWRPDTGTVCSPPVGRWPQGFWAEVECAFLNSFQARWQYVADSVGFGFAQGKTMLWRRSFLEGAGGIRTLGVELAEDAAATKLVRGAGLRVRLVDAPFGQPLGHRGVREVWDRQVRWARLRRASFPKVFALEIAAGGIWPLATVCVAISAADLPLASVIAFATVWYGAEALLSWQAGWHLSMRTLPAWIVRDLLLPAVWLSGWFGRGFVWRGNPMRIAESPGM
jgi:ceramide glucosyltransferase